MKIMMTLLSLLTLSFLSFSVWSENYSFLDDTAGQYFDDQDWALFTKGQKQALNYYHDGSKLTWKNPKTGSWGSFVPSHTSKKMGLVCRDLTIVNSANNRIGKSTLTFCKENGQWKGV